MSKSRNENRNESEAPSPQGLQCSACGSVVDRLYSRAYCKPCNCAKTTERQRRFKLACLNYLGGKCHCGESRPHLLCFAQKNLRAKLVKISSKGLPLSDTVKSQLSHCDILCRNCYYSALHGGASERKRTLVAFLGGECRLCGERRHSALEFHHINPSTKSFELGSREIRKRAMPSLIDEASKCQLLCSNCHINEHVETRNFSYGSLQQAWELEAESKQLSRRLGEVQES